MINLLIFILFNGVIVLYGLPITNDSAIASWIVTDLVMIWSIVLTYSILKGINNTYAPVTKIVNTVFVLAQVISSTLFICIKPEDIRIFIITQAVILCVFGGLMSYCIKACKNAS